MICAECVYNREFYTYKNSTHMHPHWKSLHPLCSWSRVGPLCFPSRYASDAMWFHCCIHGYVGRV